MTLKAYVYSMKGVDLTFPYDESIFDCYKDRETCKNKDLQGEVTEQGPQRGEGTEQGFEGEVKKQGPSGR